MLQRRYGMRLMAASLAACAVTACVSSPAPSPQPVPPPPADVVGSSPYLYLGWGDPPDPVTVMRTTGVRTFTLAFVLAGDGCVPRWDRDRPLLGGDDERAIDRIRAAGGDVVVSIGGSTGPKLSEKCPDPRALAHAYMRVIDAYDLRAIDIDIEKAEFADHAAQDEVTAALKIVNERRPETRIVLTFPADRSGLSDDGTRLVQRTRDLNLRIDTYAIMPFEFGGQDMGHDTLTAMEGLHVSLRDILAISPEQAHSSAGLSTLIGGTEERVYPEDFAQMVEYARANDLGRLTFWSVNRDCPGPDGDEASGIDQQPWEFLRMLADYQD